MLIEINGHRTQVVSFGDGAPTLLALGGWVAGWEVWLSPFELLSRRWRCVSFDHRGAGESEAPLDAITPGGLVDDVFAVMDALGIERCVLAGESVGAVIALEAAMRAPERFDGLVLVSGAPAVTPAAVRPLIEAARRDFPTAVAAFVDACTPEADGARYRRWGRDMLLRSNAAAAQRIFEGYLERDAPMPALGAVDLPVLLIHGTADAIVPVAVARMVAKALPRATLVELDGVGHVPPMTRPHAVVDAIVAWHARLQGVE